MTVDDNRKKDGLLQWFFGVPNRLDERGRAELGRIGTNAFIFMFFYQLVTLVMVALLSSTLGSDQAYAAQIIAIIIGLFLSEVYVGGAVRKAGLAYIEVRADRYARKRSNIISDAVINGIAACIAYLPISVLLDTGSHDFWRHAFSANKILQALLFAVILSITITIWRLLNLKKIPA